MSAQAAGAKTEVLSRQMNKYPLLLESIRIKNPY